MFLINLQMSPMNRSIIAPKPRWSVQAVNRQLLEAAQTGFYLPCLIFAAAHTAAKFMDAEFHQ